MARTPDKYYETPEFVRLNAEWQARLAREGFEDLEDDFPVAHTRDLLRDSYRDRVQSRKGEQSGMAEYMRRCGRWLHEHVWPTPKRRFVWELYCDGYSKRGIIRRMGVVPGHEGWWIGRIIEEERGDMMRWYATGGDPDDVEEELSLFDQEIAANGGFAHIPTRGEGGGGFDG